MIPIGTVWERNNGQARGRRVRIVPNPLLPDPGRVNGSSYVWFRFLNRASASRYRDGIDYLAETWFLQHYSMIVEEEG